MLLDALHTTLAPLISKEVVALGEVTIECATSDYLTVCTRLRDSLGFEQLMDLSGVDYQCYASHQGPRYAVVLHLLSVQHNYRLRLRVFAEQDDFPCLPSVHEIWPSANWYEREAFDLFGILFDGHPDLRRILTDYGFIGHPFRKDFPIIGTVEVRYDEASGRVIYQPVSIETRNNVPRIVRDEGSHHG